MIICILDEIYLESSVRTPKMCLNLVDIKVLALLGAF